MISSKKTILGIFLIYSGVLVLNAYAAKVMVITHAYNRPDFIPLQCVTLQKFLKDDYEYVVFNDARDSAMEAQINNACNAFNIRCIRIPQEIHNRPYLQRLPGENYHAPAVRNCNVVQYSLDVLGFEHDGIVAIFDSDMFLVKPFSISEYLDDAPLSGIMQSRGKDIQYLWIGLVFMDMRNLPDKKSINFNCGRVNGAPVDAGGYTYHYLKAHPNLLLRNFGTMYPHQLSCEDCKKSNNRFCSHNGKLLAEVGFDEHAIRFIHAGPPNIEFLNGLNFLHYRGGTNWDRQSAEYHRHKAKLLRNYIQDITGVANLRA